jgi:hypothetical protein
MEEKDNSSTGEQSLEHNNRGVSLSDKYVALQFENQNLKNRILQIGAALHEWRERALFFQAERDHYKEQAQERRRENW